MAKTSKAYRRAVLLDAEKDVQEILREWCEAQNSPKRRAELQALRTITLALDDAQRGGEIWKEAVTELELTPQEAAAFKVVAALWKRCSRNIARQNKPTPK